MQEVRILSPTAILGYGYPASSLAAGMARRPDAICVDAGSTDGGPSYLGFDLESGTGQAAAFSESVARDQALALAVCQHARSTILHLGFPGRISTAGNLAFPFSPLDVPVGAVYEFNIYHLLELDDPLAPFPIEWMEF